MLKLCGLQPSFRNVTIFLAPFTQACSNLCGLPAFHIVIISLPLPFTQALFAHLCGIQPSFPHCLHVVSLQVCPEQRELHTQRMEHGQHVPAVVNRALAVTCNHPKHTNHVCYHCCMDLEGSCAKEGSTGVLRVSRVKGLTPKGGARAEEIMSYLAYGKKNRKHCVTRKWSCSTCA